MKFFEAFALMIALISTTSIARADSCHVVIAEPGKGALWNRVIVDKYGRSVSASELDEFIAIAGLKHGKDFIYSIYKQGTSLSDDTATAILNPTAADRLLQVALNDPLSPCHEKLDIKPAVVVANQQKKVQAALLNYTPATLSGANYCSGIQAK